MENKNIVSKNTSKFGKITIFSKNENEFMTLLRSREGENSIITRVKNKVVDDKYIYLSQSDLQQINSQFPQNASKITKYKKSISSNHSCIFCGEKSDEVQRYVTKNSIGSFSSHQDCIVQFKQICIRLIEENKSTILSETI